VSNVSKRKVIKGFFFGNNLSINLENRLQSCRKGFAGTKKWAPVIAARKSDFIFDCTNPGDKTALEFCPGQKRAILYYGNT
jgi:hypothetical protein